MKALITGISGQDGYFLSKFLLSKGYEVHGIIRRNSSMNLGNLSYLNKSQMDQINIHYGDLTESNFLNALLSSIKPEEMYHLAAQSFVGYSFQNPSSTYDVNISGTLNVANAVREASPDTRLYFAATSELFGRPKETPQNEKTPFEPRSPYAVSKLAGLWTMRTYRDAYDLFMSNGILFNHESEMRGGEFVTRKITKAVARMKHGDKAPLELGNLNARKDWGYAKDYVEGMWKILNYKYAADFVLGTGELHTVREFVEEAFLHINERLHWKGSGVNEVGLNEADEVLVKVNREYFRPLESDNYIADFGKAERELGWTPATKFKELVRIMVKHDLETQETK